MVNRTLIEGGDNINSKHEILRREQLLHRFVSFYVPGSGTKYSQVGQITIYCLDHLDHLDFSPPLRNVVQDLYTRSTDPTEEACPRSCRIHGSHPAT